MQDVPKNAFEGSVRELAWDRRGNSAWRVVGAAALTGFALLYRSTPGRMVSEWRFLWLAALCGGAVYLLWPCLNALLSGARSNGRVPATRQVLRSWRSLFAVICVTVILSTFLFNWPLIVRFRLSRSALEREAVVVLHNFPEPADGGIRWRRHSKLVGFYLIDAIGCDGRAVYFATYDGFLGLEGFEYRPDSIQRMPGLPIKWGVFTAGT